MSLPEEFCFTQTSLTDYLACPRRFELRYLLHQPWPRVRSEPFLEYELAVERGIRFHRMIERHQLGVPSEVLSVSVRDDPVLLEWWSAYLDFGFLHSLSGIRYPEHLLSVRVGRDCFRAKYDLIVVQPGESSHVWIFDWKTGVRNFSVDYIVSSLQTKLYLWLISLASSTSLVDFGGLARFSMVYWSPLLPAQPVFLSSDQFDLDAVAASISGVVREIRHSDVWSLVSDFSVCRLCEYATLCARPLAFSDPLDVENVPDAVTLPDFLVVGDVGF